MENNQHVDDVSLWDWIVTLILTGIPVLNLFMLLYWSLNRRTKRSKKNYARASLLLIFIVLILYIITLEVTTGYFLFKHY